MKSTHIEKNNNELNGWKHVYVKMVNWPWFLLKVIWGWVLHATYYREGLIISHTEIMILKFIIIIIKNHFNSPLLVEKSKGSKTKTPRPKLSFIYLFIFIFKFCYNQHNTEFHECLERSLLRTRITLRSPRVVFETCQIRIECGFFYLILT